MNFLQQALAYIFTAANWSGKTGLGTRILEHLQCTGVAVAVSGADRDPDRPADRPPPAAWSFLVVTAVNSAVAPPTLGVLLLGVLL